MNKILICPGDRSQVAFLSQTSPLVNLPLLGESIIGHWMEFLAASGVTKVLVLATDRPEQVREVVGDGSRWGLAVEVLAELQELGAADAYGKFGPGGSRATVERLDDILTLDHFPGFPTYPLFTSYSVWFSAVQTFLLTAMRNGRLGFREIKPGVWAGLRSQIAASVELRAPCWIGNNVRIGPDSVIGPRAILEERVVVERAAEIAQSLVGPETFVGQLTRVQDSLAWGNTLINWRTGSCTQVPDAFLMSPLSQRYFVATSRNHEPYGQGSWSLFLKRRGIFSGLRARFRGSV